MRWEGLTIWPIPSPHGPLEHYSYLVEWAGQRLYFTGDTEDTAGVLRAPDLDVAFVSPWLLKRLKEADARPPIAGRVVVYHHKPDEPVAAFQERTVPSPGDVLKLASRRSTDARPVTAETVGAKVEPADTSEFGLRFEEARRNLATAAGQAYEQEFSTHFTPHYPRNVSECLQRTGANPPVAGFEVLVKLAVDGSVEQAMARPETDVATCFRDLVQRGRYPVPPLAGYWIVLGVRFGK